MLAYGAAGAALGLPSLVFLALTAVGHSLTVTTVQRCHQDHQSEEVQEARNDPRNTYGQPASRADGAKPQAPLRTHPAVQQPESVRIPNRGRARWISA